MTGTPSGGPRERDPARRVLVAIDASSASRAAIEAAADLASRLDADVVGLFVEDADLLRLGGHEVSRFSWSPGTPATDDVESTVRALTAAARRALESAARRAHVRFTFRVTRGRVAAEVVAASSGADMVCLGAATWTGLAGGRLGSTARDVLTRAESAVLVLRRRETLRRPFVVAWDGSEAAHRALRSAAALAAANRAALVLAVPAGADVTAPALALRGTAAPATVRTVPSLDATAISRVVRAVGGGVVVLPRSPGCDELARALLARTGVAVLVAR